MHDALPPTVILLHSSGSSARQWQALSETLAPQFRVHAIDFHDHGNQREWSSTAPLTLADEAALASPLLPPEGAHVIGHSYGGAIALKLATMHPQQVRSVAVYEPVMFRWLIDDIERQGSLQEVTEVADSMRELIKIGAEHQAAERFVDFWSGAGSWESMPARGRETIAKRIHAVLRHFDALYREPVERARLASLKVPMLFLSGAETVAIARRVAEVFHRSVPHCRQEVLPAMGHMGPITHVNEVNQRLLKFLQAQDSLVDMKAAA